MNNDLISRSALLEAYDKAHQGPPGGARKLIENVPEAVIRCKDCKYGEDCVPPCEDRYCVFYDERHNENWFCADGKRKGEDE